MRGAADSYSAQYGRISHLGLTLFGYLRSFSFVCGIFEFTVHCLLSIHFRYFCAHGCDPQTGRDLDPFVETAIFEGSSDHVWKVK